MDTSALNNRRVKKETKNFSPQHCRRNSHRFFSRPRGFTLLEMLLSMTILSILIVVGGRYARYGVDAKKYQDTNQKLVTIRRAIIGDERLNCLGLRADYGYFEQFKAFPPPEGGGADEVPTTALANFLSPRPVTATFDPYKVDEWGNDLLYATGTAIQWSGGDPTYTYIEVRSYGKDGPAGGGTTIFDEDSRILIRRDLFEDNMMIMNVMDANGTVLRGVSDILGNPWDHQVYRIQIRDVVAAAWIYDTEGVPDNIAYQRGVFTIAAGEASSGVDIPTGLYRVYVLPTTGGGANSTGIRDHRDDLAGNVAAICQIVPIYPKDPLAPNFVEFRLPGVVNSQEL